MNQTDFNDLAVTKGKDEVRRQLTNQVHPKNRLELHSADFVASLPHLEWLVKHMLPRAGIAAIYGPPGSGKTFLVADLIMHVAAGQNWFGHRVKRGPVVYCALEGQAGLSVRLQACRKHFGYLPEDIHILLSRFDLRERGDVADLVAAIQSKCADQGLVVLDTLNAASPGSDENSSVDMGEMIAAAKNIQTELDCLVLLVHHTGKNIENGLRGHSSLLGALDASIEVGVNGNNRSMRLAKSKDGRSGVEFVFSLEVVHLGNDGDGDPVTSCVVVPKDAESGFDMTPQKTLRGNQKIVWDTLRDLFNAIPIFGDNPDGPRPEKCLFPYPYLALEPAIERIRDKLPVDPRRKTERTRAAITGLINKGMLVLDDGYIWPSY